LNNSFVLAWTPPYVIAASRLLTISLTVILSRKLPKARRAPSTTISRDCIPRSSAPTNETDPYHSRLHSGITRRTGDKNTPSVFASFSRRRPVLFPVLQHYIHHVQFFSNQTRSQVFTMRMSLYQSPSKYHALIVLLGKSYSAHEVIASAHVIPKQM